MILASGATLAVACPKPRDVQKSRNRVDLALDLLSKGDDVGAEGEIKKAVAFDAGNEEAYNVWGMIYVKRAADKTTLVEYLNCLEGIEGEVLRTERDEAVRTAESKFKQAVRLAPDYGDAWQNLGWTALHFHDYDKAIEYETKALESIARLPIQSELLARINLGWAYVGKQKYLEAATEFLQALQKDPSHCLAIYRLAVVLFKREQFGDAAERLRVFFPRDDEKGAHCPPVVEAFHLAGQTSMRLREHEDARTAFETCLAAAPRSCLAKQCKKALSELN